MCDTKKAIRYSSVHFSRIFVSYTSSIHGIFKKCQETESREIYRAILEKIWIWIPCELSQEIHKQFFILRRMAEINEIFILIHSIWREVLNLLMLSLLTMIVEIQASKVVKTRKIWKKIAWKNSSDICEMVLVKFFAFTFIYIYQIFWNVSALGISGLKIWFMVMKSANKVFFKAKRHLCYSKFSVNQEGNVKIMYFH